MKRALRWIGMGLLALTLMVTIVITINLVKVYSLLPKVRTALKTPQFTPVEQPVIDRWRVEPPKKSLDRASSGQGAEVNDQKKPEEDAEFEGGRRKAEQQYEDISRIMVLYKSQIDHVDLCNVSCEGLPQMLSEMQDYVGGEGYTVENPPMGNPGFQLAALSGQAAFGKKMIGLFDILHQITADPVSLKSIEAYKAAWIFEEALSGFEKRGKEPLLELGSLLKLLSSLERTCSEESWARDCQILEEDIVEWIEDGALE